MCQSESDDNGVWVLLQHTNLNPAPPGRRSLAWRPQHTDRHATLSWRSHTQLQWIYKRYGYLSEPWQMHAFYMSGKRWHKVYNCYITHYISPLSLRLGTSSVSYCKSPGLKRLPSKPKVVLWKYSFFRWYKTFTWCCKTVFKNTFNLFYIKTISWYPIGSYSLVQLLKHPYGLRLLDTCLLILEASRSNVSEETPYSWWTKSACMRPAPQGS